MATLPLSWNPFWKLCTVHTAEQQDEAALEMHGKRWLRMHLLQRSCFPSLFRHALLQHVSQKLKCNVWSFRHWRASAFRACQERTCGRHSVSMPRQLTYRTRYETGCDQCSCAAYTLMATPVMREHLPLGR